MNEYHKINTIYKRDMVNNGKIIEGEYSCEEFEYLKDNKWVATEKVDGTNIRVMWNGENVMFGGKTDSASIPVFLLYKLQELFEGTQKKELFKEKFGEEGGVCFYGEGYGNKIQKAGKDYISDGTDFVLFDVKVGKLWLKREDVEDIANFLGIKVVPIVSEFTLGEAVEKAKQGFDSQWGNFTAEGLVLKPKTELLDRRGYRIVTKVKYKDFNY